MEFEIDVGSDDMAQREPKVEEQFDDFELTTRHYHLYMNRGSRREMLDRYAVGANHFAIFDGHGTSEVADFLSQKLPPKLHDQMDAEDYKRVFKETDAQLAHFEETGSVALLLSIQNKTVTIASLGDSRAVVIKDDAFERISVSHLPSREEERALIESKGGWVMMKGKVPRVQGTLAVSRSFGDFALKKYITCEPEITKYAIQPSDKYVVMASDGFWNQISEEQVVAFLKAENNEQSLAKGLFNLIKKETDYIKDNITIFVIPI